MNTARTAAAAMAIALGLGVAACSTGGTPTIATTAATTGTTATTPAKPSTFTMTGELKLMKDGEGTVISTGDGHCEGTGGYSDITDGAAVVVYGRDGSIVGTGSVTNTVMMFDYCLLQWEADAVPSGEKFYQYEISHRGKLTISESAAKAGDAAATLGG